MDKFVEHMKNLVIPEGISLMFCYMFQYFSFIVIVKLKKKSFSKSGTCNGNANISDKNHVMHSFELKIM